jgi:hypothetical protein
MLAVPLEYSAGFIGRAFLMETNQRVPAFRVALSVEAFNGKYSCSLEVFLGDVKVWNSGHYSRFYTRDKCVLELTDGGDLRLMGPNKHVGWRAGTSGQGVEVKLRAYAGSFLSVSQQILMGIAFFSLLHFDAEIRDTELRESGSS